MEAAGQDPKVTIGVDIVGDDEVCRRMDAIRSRVDGLLAAAGGGAGGIGTAPPMMAGVPGEPMPRGVS